MSAQKSISTQFSGVSMTSLIGAPLRAAVNANSMMCHSQTDFLLSTCFGKSQDKEGHLSPIMIHFQVERSVISASGEVADEPIKMKVSVPLMSLIPISSLAIETIKLTFDMEVTSSSDHEAKSILNSSRPDETDSDVNLTQKTELHGTLSQKSDNSDKDSSSANYQVELSAGQLPLPRGLTAILDVFDKNIAPLPASSTSLKSSNEGSK